MKNIIVNVYYNNLIICNYLKNYTYYVVYNQMKQYIIKTLRYFNYKRMFLIIMVLQHKIYYIQNHL